jgi:uncharacterized protein YpmB
VRKILPPPGFNPQTVLPVASRIPIELSQLIIIIIIIIVLLLPLLPYHNVMHDMKTAQSNSVTHATLSQLCAVAVKIQ